MTIKGAENIKIKILGIFKNRTVRYTTEIHYSTFSEPNKSQAESGQWLNNVVKQITL